MRKKVKEGKKMKNKNCGFLKSSLLIIIMTFTALSMPYLFAASGNLPGGTSIEVTIDSPVTCTDFLVPVGGKADVVVSGTASIGEGVPVADTTLIYVLDASGSTASYAGGDVGPEQNPSDPETVEDEIIDAEIAAAINLNDEAVALGTIDEVAAIIFAGSAIVADMTPGGGDDPIIHPDADADSDGEKDVEEVLHSIWVAEYVSEYGRFNQFNVKDISDIYGTDFTDAISAVLSVAALATNPNIIVVFLSDGLANAGDPITTVLPGPSNVVFYTFAVGTDSDCTSDPYGLGSLKDIADLTGGSCTHVIDPSNLPDVLPELVLPALNSLEISVNGGLASPIDNVDIDPDLPIDGPASVSYTTSVFDLDPGDHQICVTAYGTDVGGSGCVTECVTIHVVEEVQIDIKPGSWPNPLQLLKKGVLPVAVCGTEDFDVTTIDPATIRLTMNGMGVAPLRWSYEDVATPWMGEPCGGHDLNGDGYLDLTLKFDAQEVIYTLGLDAFNDRDVIALILKGALKTEFGGTSIQGQDCIVILEK
jgi:hypothetical protein